MAAFRAIPDKDRAPAHFLRPVTAPGGIRFKKVVFLGYTDMAAAGSRALLGLDMRREYETVEIHGMELVEMACRRPNQEEATEQKFQPIQILQCKYEEFTLVIFNCTIPSSMCHHVADWIMTLCINSNVEKLVILTTQKLDQIEEMDMEIKPLYENAYKDPPVTRRPPVPKDVKIMDPFLSSLIQMIQIENFPCNIFTAPGHKAVPGPANDCDGSFQAVLQFHDVLKKWSRLEFDKDFSLSLVYRDLTTDSDMMYN